MKNEFVWGVSSSAFQIEGATSEGGRGLSTWDVYTRTPGKILNGDTADIACDHYHRYREDVKLMAELGVTGYRFSIAWPRIVPDGVGAPNPAGIAFYSDLIDTLLEYGIQPYPTLYHWDLPVINQFVADGWLSRQTAEAFARYAGICFEAFGDRVRHWITLNRGVRRSSATGSARSRRDAGIRSSRIWPPTISCSRTPWRREPSARGASTGRSASPTTATGGSR